MENTIFRTGDVRQQAIDRLHAEPCSCVIQNGSLVRVCHERGVKDLYRLLREEPSLLKGAFIADKVVGKGAAALMILGGVRELFADVVSIPACDLLRLSGVEIHFTHQVEHIANRTQTGICPVEQLCSECTTAAECLPKIEQFLQSIKDRG